MDYEKLAKEFCEMHFLRMRRRIDMEKYLSATGEEGVLLCIYHFHKKILAGQISKILELSPGRVTNIINVLEKRGYIAKTHDEIDKRKVYILLTDAGRAHIQEKYEEAVHRYRMLFEALGEQDAKEYFRILKRIHQIAQQQKETYAPPGPEPVNLVMDAFPKNTSQHK